MRALISFVMCGITCTVAPRKSPFRSLRSTVSQIAPALWLAVCEEVLVDEALVVADVEVGLGAVLGDEDLAVLERAHRPRVDVQVRIELLQLDAQAARFEQPAERGGDDSLAERRDDAPGDEDVLRGARALTGFKGSSDGGRRGGQDRSPVRSSACSRSSARRRKRSA